MLIKASYASRMPHPSPIVVMAPDSFKGSVSAADAAAAIGEGLRRVWPDVELRPCPMADGGEGTLDAVLARGGTRLHARVTGAGGNPVDAAYGTVDDGRRVIIDAAQVVGLTDNSGVSVDVERRTTRGLGELMRKQLDAGARDFMVALGGSSTNDGGAGFLAALGLALADANGRNIDPTPEGLASLASIDASSLDPRIRQSRITIMSDVNNPLTGGRRGRPQCAAAACTTLHRMLFPRRRAGDAGRLRRERGTPPRRSCRTGGTTVRGSASATHGLATKDTPCRKQVAGGAPEPGDRAWYTKV